MLSEAFSSSIGASVIRVLGSALTAGAWLVVAGSQQAQALSLACCTDLDEMVQSSDLIIRGRALADFNEVTKLHLSEAEYQARIAAGTPFPLGASVVIHDGDWQLVEQFIILPVKVLEVVEGETTEQVISVVQNNDWGAVPMKKDTEYLLFLQRPLPSESVPDFYCDFYGQGTYNLDGKDPRTSSAGYYDAEAVEERYGDRVEFASLPAEQNARIIQPATQKSKVNWFNKGLNVIRQWFRAM